jgi:predicted O-methyltransferase YrrM
MILNVEDYFEPRPRFGHGLPAHVELLRSIEARRSIYCMHLTASLHYLPQLVRIPRDSTYWLNDQFSGLDSLALYYFVASRQPSQIIEIGSGHSTCFARRAIDDHGLGSRLTSIDPEPRTGVDQLCHNVIRKRLEECDLSFADELGERDIVFFDGSHRCFTNSDVTVFFLEVLPRLKPGVLVHIHDVYLPFDYPAEIADRFYSEQYLLACYMLGGGRKVQVELPNAYVSQDSELHGLLKPVWDNEDLRGVTPYGVSFWFTA